MLMTRTTTVFHFIFILLKLITNYKFEGNTTVYKSRIQGFVNGMADLKLYCSWNPCTDCPPIYMKTDISYAIALS